MKMIKRSTVRKISKVLNTFVVMMMVLQPVGTPSILGAIALADETAVQSADAQAPAPDTKADPAPADPVAPKEEPAPAPVPAPKEEPKVDPLPVVQDPAPAETPAPEPVVTPPSTETPAQTPADTTPSDMPATTTPTSANTPISPAIDSTPTISPDAAATEAPVIEQTGKICLEQGANIVSSDRNYWTVSGDTAETKNKVELGVKYVFPGNDSVSVTFTCLPAASADRTTLKIQQIASADINLPEGVSAATDFAYDITTGMKDGDFKYDLTMPKADVADADINYIEKTADEATTQEVATTDLKSVDDTKVKTETNDVKVEELDHFTVFVQTYADPAHLVVKDKYKKGETIFILAGDLNLNRYYKIAIDPPGNDNLEYLTTSCTKNLSQLTAEYTVPNSANIGSNWNVEIHGFSTLDFCNNANSLHTPTDTKTFEISSGAVSNGSTITGSCAQDAFGSHLNCTANDLTLASVSQSDIHILDDGCAFPGDTVTFSAKWTLSSNATLRYNIGLYFASQGQNNALTGSCSVSTLPTGPSPFFETGSDSCGEISSAQSLQPEITMMATCVDNGSNQLRLPYCTSWQQNENSSCSGPSQAFPGTSSKCTCNTGFSIPITVPFGAKIEVIKDLIPSSDPGKFNLQINGSVAGTGANVSDGGITGKIDVSAGTSASPGATHKVGETAGTSTNLSDYTSSISCVKRGTSTVVASGLGTGPLDVHVNKDDDVVCTITNTLKTGTLEIKKDVVPNDASTNWNINVTGPSPFSDTLTGDDMTGAKVANPGSYTITETAAPGTDMTKYDSTWACMNGSTNTSGTGTTANVDIAEDEAAVCTFTNALRTGHIIVDKVTNPSGDSQSFAFTTTGTGYSGFSLTDASAQNDQTLNAGSYSVSETVPSGWDQASATCISDIGDTESAGALELDANETIRCTFTNDKNPIFTVVKTVVNDNGGIKTVGDFGINFSGGTLIFDGGAGSGTTKTYTSQTLTLNSGLYTLSENDIAGYTEGTWDCGTPDSTGISTSITLAPGDNKTCTITNDDVAPTLKLVKTVTTDNGGTADAGDWDLTSTGTVLGFTDKGDSTTFHTVKSGEEYTLSESGPDGYAAGSWSCVGGIQNGDKISLGLDDDVTCTINNNDNIPALHLRKTVTKDNGGSANDTDWTLTATGTDTTPTNLSGITPVDSGANFKTDTYELAENGGPGGYTASTWNCVGGTMLDATHVTVALGQDVTCTINNNDDTASLTVIKHVINDNGGTKIAANFTMNVTGTNVSPTASFPGAENPGTTVTLNAGLFSVDESSVFGYEKSFSGDCSGPIALGEHKTCTINNNDIQPKLIVIKHVINDNGGTAVASNFTMHISGTAGSATFAGVESPGVSTQVNAGTFSVTEDAVAGYSPSNTGDCSGTIGVGETKTCTITNNDIQSTLQVIQTFHNDHGGTATFFPLTIDTTIHINSGDITPLNSGTHAIYQGTGAGYNAVFSGDCTQVAPLYPPRNGQAILGIGENKICYIDNYDIAPTIRVVKQVVNTVGGPTKTAGDFTINVSGTNVSPSSFPGSGTDTLVTLDAGTFSITETADPDYTASYALYCSGNVSVDGSPYRCSITNTRNSGSLRILKNVDLNGDGDYTDEHETGATDWQWQATGPVNKNGNTSDTAVTVPTGGYVLSETDKPDFHFSNLNCTGGTLDPATKTVTVAKDANVICTFENLRDTGNVTFEKIIDGTPTDPNAWTFNITGANGNYTAKNGDVKSLPIGTYTITESGGPSNYHWSSSSGVCSGPDGSDGVLTVTASGGTCTIVNKRDISAFTAQKLDENNQPVAGWKFKLNDGAWQETDVQGRVAFNSLETGNYTVTEESRAGSYLSEVTSTGDFCQKVAANNNSATVTVPYSVNPVCVFKNIPIPKYEGPSTCPADTPVKKLINSYSIGAQDADGEALAGLAAGNYLFEATETFVSSSGGGWKSDAAYSSNNNWSSIDTNYGIHGIAPNYGAHALLADLGSGVGVVEWGSYNAGHQYSLYTSSPANPQFLIGDRYSNWYGTPYDNQAGMNDNSGSLNLNVYECVAPKGTIEIKKEILPADTTTFWNFGIDAGYTLWDTWKTDGYSSGPIEVDPGSHSVVEQTAPGTDGTQYSSSLICKDGDTVVATGGPASLVYGQNLVSTDFSVVADQHIVCTFTNKKPVKINAKKVVCDNEADLPNWGGGGHAIDANTAQDYVNASSGKCQLEDQWTFQWSKAGGGGFGDFQKNTDTLGSPWNTFNVVQPAEINDTSGLGGRIEVREIIPTNSGQWVGFSNDSANNFSSEFYCSGDAANYDNWEWINNPQYGQTYQCVAFNAHATPEIKIDKTGSDFAKSGDPVTYNYAVTNPGNVPLSNVSVSDDKCSPVNFVDGDTNGNSKLDLAETWNYECSTTPVWSFNTKLTNTATATGEYDGNTVTAEDLFDLYSFVLRKDVKLEGDRDYDDPDTEFDVEVKKNGNVVGATTISESNPSEMWLSAGTYQFCEMNMPDGYTPFYPGGCISFSAGENYGSGSGYPDWSQINIFHPVKVNASKIVCDNEADLPNWGAGVSNNITEITAQRWVNTHSSCHLEEDWQFQWSLDGVGNPGDNVELANSGWNTFGTTGVEITNPATPRLWFREALKPDYIPFAYGATGNSNNVSAEFYCNNDVLNYDNWEFIENPQFGQNYYCVAFNVKNNGSITAHKFSDRDGDAQQGSGEENLAGWEMKLYGSDQSTCEGTPLQDSEQTTFPEGNAEFTGLAAGDYYVGETAKEGWKNTTPSCQKVTVQIDQNSVVNFGNQQLGKIIVEKQTLPDGSAQAFDFTSDYDADGFSLSDGQTNNSGFLASDTYSVAETVPAGWDQTSAICSDGSNSSSIVLDPNETVTCTFTNTQRGSITAHKFADFDKSGVQDAGEPDVQYFQMSLYQGNSCSGSPTSQLDTENDGKAIFNNLISGDYSIKETLPTPGDPGTGWWTNISPLCQNVHIDYGQNQQVNFANFRVQQLTVCKYNDINGDGHWQPGDNPLSGWTVNLSGPESLSGVTGGDGCARIPINIYGGYVVTEVLQPGWLQTFPSEPQTAYAEYSYSTGLQLYNFQLGSISGQKFNDLNGNGVKDAGENGISVWTINLDKDADGTIDATTTTDANGNYTFSSLTAGTYRVREVGQTGWQQKTTDPSDISIQSGTNATGADFGNVQLGNIHGYKWNDLNSNGERNCLAEEIWDGEEDLFSRVSFICREEDREPLLSDWTINLYKSNGDGGYDLINSMLTDSGSEHFGWYWFENLMPGQYKVCEVLQDGWNQTYPINGDANCHLISLPDGNSNGFEFPEMLNAIGGPVYGFGNYQLGTVTVTKFNDLNENGTKDDGEPVLPDWDINLAPTQGTATTQKTETPNGQTTFANLVSGEFSLSENIQTGWNQTNISCQPADRIAEQNSLDSGYDSANQNYGLTVKPGETRSCFIGNHRIPPSLTIQKSNNNPAPGIVLAPGDSVVYTLKVTAKDNDVNGVTVTDLPPDGFTYVPGSETASSDNPGHVGALALQHAYASPGVWDLGDMKKDEVVTLTYKTNISPSQESGTYPDLAWTAGKSLVNEDILGTGENSQYVDGAFVGTQVAVVKQGTVLGASVKIETDKETDHKKDKIVKKTRVLPATGERPIWPIAAGIVLLAGIALMVIGKKRKKGENSANIIPKIMIGALLAASLFIGTHATHAASTDLAARMMTPDSPYQTTDFNLGFVALDLKSNPVTVQCFLNGSGTPYQTVNLAGGGTSGNCNVNSSVIPGSGSYQFHITVTNGAETITSPDVSLEVITGGPGTPTNYDRVKSSNCDYQISFVTANDGDKTVKVELYRSTERTYVADATTKIDELAIGSNQSGSFATTKPVCGDDYYYAIRAFDKLGNGSGVVSDTRTVTVTTGGGTTTVTTTTTAPGGGAIPVAAGGAVAGEATAAGGAAGGTVEGAQTPSEEQGQTPSGAEQGGQVLGEEQAKNEAGQTGFGKHPYLYSLAGLIVLYLLYYAYRKMGKKGDLKPPRYTPKGPNNAPPANPTV